MQGELRRNILVVDDEEGTRAVICRHLEFLGHHAESAASGCEALRMVTEAREPYDLVVLDMRMPGMDGEATFTELNKLKPELLYLLCTGACDMLAMERLLSTGFCELLHKPFTQGALRDKTAGLLSRVPRRQRPEFASVASPCR